MKTLVPCAGCGRHVRTSDAACPFCGQSIESDATSRAPGRTHGARLGRAAIFAFGATIAATAAACSPASNPDASGNDAQVQDSAPDAGNMALYGGPPVDAGPTDDGGTMPLYGGPPADSGVDNDAGDGSPGARYGAPPVDAG